MPEVITKAKICNDCRAEFEGKPRAKRCESCRVEHKRTMVRERMRAWRAARPKTPLPDLACEDCGKLVERPMNSRKTKKYCDSCLADRVRQNSHRAYLKRIAENPPVKMQRTCLDCPADLTGTPGSTRRCKPCSDAHKRNRMRNYLREWKRAQPKNVYRCKTCDVVLDREGKSGVGSYCDDCRPAAVKANQERATAKAREKRGVVWATHCHYCNVKFDRPRQPAKSPNRCDECKKDRHRAYIKVYWATRHRGFDHARRARKMGRGYESIKSKDIFDRDGWRCGICRKKIHKRLRYPHPMSASLDHKIPFAKGGTHSRSNVQAAHLRCNLRKHDAAAPLGEQIPLPI